MMTIPLSIQETKKGEAICPYCGVGCRLLMESADGELIRVKGVADAPANLGGICAKGATLPEVIRTPDRLTQPHVRPARSKEPRPMKWADALGWTAARFREIVERHGPDAVAFYGSGQLDSEASYLAVKLFKGSIGTNNTDSNSRLCMASAVTGYQTSLGADGPPCCYADIDLSDCLVVWGSNMADAFPVTFNRMKARLKAKPGVELIVVDPRRTNTANYATLYVPVAPGGDIPLMNAVGRLLLERGAVDHDFVAAHTEGFAVYRDFLLHADWKELVSAAGVPEALIGALADRLARSRALLTFYCQGFEPEHRRHVEEQQHHQPPPVDRADRQAGRGAIQPHRPAERDGGPRNRVAGAGAAGLPVLRGPRPPRRGRGVLETPRGNNLDEAGIDGRRDVSGTGSRATQGDLDRGHQSHGQSPRPASSPARPVRGRTHRCPGPVPPDRDDAVRRRPAPGGAVGREDGHHDEQRAARLL